MPSPVDNANMMLRHVCPPGREKMILVGQKSKTQAVERPPGDVHLRLVAVDVINGSLNGGDFLSASSSGISVSNSSSRAITS